MAGAMQERSKRGRAALAAYRAFGYGMRPLLGPWLRARAGRGKEVRSRLGERLGRASAARPEGPLIWLHAASVGELKSVLPLVGRLRALGLETLVTTGTVTSAAIAEKELPAGAIHQFNALDIVPAVRAFLDHWSPDLAILVESEIWPVTLRELSKRQIHQVMVNARMSDRSFARWSRRPALARSVFGAFGHVIAQSALDGERFSALGSPRVSVAGNLKADGSTPPADEAALATLRQAMGDRPAWVAASLHPAEDVLVADAAARLKARRANALSIVAPRHPERGDAMRTVLERQGLVVAQRSRREPVGAETDVLLADTLGEMGLWYRSAPVVFMGKSLASDAGAEGGQNPLEPAVCGAAILSGRAVANFREAYRQLLLDGGAKFVDDAAMLARFVAHIWDRPEALAAMQAGSSRTVLRMAGALDRTLDLLDPWLAPLRMQAMLERTRTVTEGHKAGLSAARLRAIRDAEIAGRGGPFVPISNALSRRLQPAEDAARFAPAGE